MSELDDVLVRLEARCDRLDAMLREMIARLESGPQQDVPLHQRGSGVMDEPPV